MHTLPQVLCTLPFAGVVLLPSPPSASGAAGSPPESVPLLREAVRALQRRAHNLDLSARPQPYRVLFDFLVQRNELRGAARAMAAYAWRLRAEADSTPQAVAEALQAYGEWVDAVALLVDLPGARAACRHVGKRKPLP